MNERLIRSQGVSRNSSLKSLSTSICLRHLVWSNCTLFADRRRWFHSIASVCLREAKVQTSSFCSSFSPLHFNNPELTFNFENVTSDRRPKCCSKHSTLQGSSSWKQELFREKNGASDTRKDKSWSKERHTCHLHSLTKVFQVFWFAVKQEVRGHRRLLTRKQWSASRWGSRHSFWLRMK